jgi:structural maintenance of chromosome 2
MDLIIIPIPSVMVWGLQMHRRTKILVVIVMSLGWIATGVSVGRFIVYYYRFAPTNKDRTWDIGIGISIAEPAVHIMTACAPATKCLFRYLFPQYGTNRNTSYYEDRTADTNRHNTKVFGNFHFGLSNNPDDEITMEGIGGAPRTAPLPPVKDESEYGLKAVGSFESKEYVAKGIGRKKSCSKTACTEASEPVEVEPKHCLGQAR